MPKDKPTKKVVKSCLKCKQEMSKCKCGKTKGGFDLSGKC
jgi:hypothetical protein